MIGDDHNTGTWIIALIKNGEGYLGRVNKLDDEPAYETAVIDGTTDGNAKKMARDHVPIREIMAAKHIELFPVYDYREMVKEIPMLDQNGKMVPSRVMPGMPEMQPMRTPLVMPVGFTLEPHPVHVPGLCYGTHFRFLSQMEKRDADTQRNFAKDTRAAMKDARLAASNLVAPTPDELSKLRR